MAAWYSFADLFLSHLDAETAHGLALRALKTGLLPSDRRPDAASLTVSPHTALPRVTRKGSGVRAPAQ